MKWILEGGPIISSFHDPKTFFVTEFTPQSLKSFENTINESLKLDQKILPIFIESEGGSSFVLNGYLSLIDGAREAGLKISTIVNGFAFSAGFFLFCYGDEDYRFIGSSATLMAHGQSLASEGKLADVKSYVDFQNSVEKPFLEKISKHIGKRKDWLSKKLLFNQDWFMTSEQAVQEGIATKIHSPIFHIETKSFVSVR